MAFEEKTIDSQLIYKGPVFNIRKYKVTATGNQVTYRDVVEHSGGAVIVAVEGQWQRAPGETVQKTC